MHKKHKKIKLKKVRYIAIGEIYLGKKRKFITIVLDLDSGRVIHIGQGKGKAALLGFWEHLKRSKAKVKAEIQAWINEANTGGIKILKDAAKELLIWKPFILNWHNHPISTSKLEATNHTIGLLQRLAHGYRDAQYLKLRIYHVHTNTNAFAG